MQVFNVEIFDRSYNLADHFEINEIHYKEDFLSYESNTFQCDQTSAEVGQFLRITSDQEEHSGIITAVDSDKNKMKVTFKEWQEILDIDFLCYTANLSSTTLEQFIAGYIDCLYISNADAKQNIQGMKINILSATTGTIDFEIETDSSGNKVTTKVLNLYSGLVLPAFKAYGVRVMLDYEPAKKMLIVNIGKSTAGKITIEADLKTCQIDKLYLNKAANNVNKVTVYNELSWTQSLSYYLLTDGTIGTDAASEKRRTPVELDVETVSYDSTTDTDTTFETLAAEAAKNKFTENTYENLIQLEFEKTDALVNPLQMEIGQLATVIHNGTEYATYLTAREFGDKITLIFGNVRQELTKKLLGRA